jgi:hypothetical protein
MVSRKNHGFQVSESRPNHVRLNVSKCVRGCADDNALNGWFGNRSGRSGCEVGGIFKPAVVCAAA